MRAFVAAVFVFVSLINAGDITPAKYAKMVQKGEKIALKLCNETKLSQIKSKTLPEILLEIDSLKPCVALNSKNREALAYFLMAGASGSGQFEIKGDMQVPHEAKCPVCGMFVAKYPKWAASITHEGMTNYFDGVKDMMKFYIFDVDFPYDRSKITHIEVTDFYTLHTIDAKSAFYVVGSDVYGPMGNELIPFSTKEAANNFTTDHHGEKIVLFEEITPTLVMGLDGMDYP